MRLTGLVAKCRAIDLLLWVILVGASFRSFGAQVAQQAFVYGFGQSSKKTQRPQVLDSKIRYDLGMESRSGVKRGKTRFSIKDLIF